MGTEGGGVGEGALSMRKRRLISRVGVARDGVGAAGGGGSGPFGAAAGGLRMLGDAGMVGRLGLPLLVLRRCREVRALATSSGRGGSAEEGGWVVGGDSENRDGRSVNVSLNVVFVAGAECGGRVGYAFIVGVGNGDGSGTTSVLPLPKLPNSSTPDWGVGGNAILGTGL